MVRPPSTIARVICTFVATCSAALVGAGEARAGNAFDDPYDLPDAPRPPTLPELTHPELETTLESTVGALGLRGNEPGLTPARGAFVQRIGLEVPLGPRRWFVGANYETAVGTPPGGSLKFVGSNLELYGRTVWATRTGLAFGGGLGVLAPTAHFEEGGRAGSLALTASAIRPWDASFFSPNTFGARPFVDVRDVTGAFVVQFRQGLDVLFDTRDVGRWRIFAVTGLYMGYRLGRWVSPGIEAFELYAVDAPVRDRLRPNVVVSPSVRVMTPYVQPALSFFTNIGPVFYGAAEQVFGVRMAITLVYDPTTRTMKRDREGPADLPFEE